MTLSPSTVVNQIPPKPFLKWAGGKRQLLPIILENYIPRSYGTYYEVFLGGGAMLCALQPTKAVINDNNQELINCYQVIRDSLALLIEQLGIHQNDPDYYYEIRAWDRETNYHKRSCIEKASRIIYLNKTCYNGLYRVNTQGQFNVPFGRYKNPSFYDKLSIEALSRYLNQADVNILNLDFEKAVSSAKKNDFIYCDPPYDPVSETASFTAYGMRGFNRDEQIRLKKTVDGLAKKGCKILLSNASTDFIKNLYCDYKIVTIPATRMINSQGQKRGKVEEVLIMNYEL